MQFSKLLTVILFNIIFLSAMAQQQATTVQKNSFGEVTNLRDAISSKTIQEVTIYGGDNEIPYSRTTGSRFWRDEWQSAALYNKNKMLGIIPVKLNLVNSEIHVIINKEELVLTNDITSLIFFKENDSSISTAAFIRNVPNLFLDNKKLDDFVQVLNYGHYQLLKYRKRYVAVGDSLFRTVKRYYFSDKHYYFLKSGDKVERARKLNKDNVLAFLPSSSAYAEWIKSNNIDFKKENDIIRFLDHYNASKPK